MKMFTRETIDPDCSHVCLTGYGDMHLKTTFPSVTHLMLYKCDKNFVYYNTNHLKFPNLKKLWIFAHPCGGGGGEKIQYAFPDTLIYASKEYEKYYSKYSSNKVVFLSEETVQLIMEPLLA
jgi:hypothetical protein